MFLAGIGVFLLSRHGRLQCVYDIVSYIFLYIYIYIFFLCIHITSRSLHPSFGPCFKLCSTRLLFCCLLFGMRNSLVFFTTSPGDPTAVGQKFVDQGTVGFPQYRVRSYHSLVILMYIGNDILPTYIGIM